MTNGIGLGARELAQYLSQVLSKAGAQFALQLHRPRRWGFHAGAGTLADGAALVASASTGRIRRACRSDVELQTEGGRNTLQGRAQRGASLEDAAKLSDGNAGADREWPQPLTFDVLPYRGAEVIQPRSCHM